MNFPSNKKRGQGITHVSDLFKKYALVLRAPQGHVIKAFIEVVEEMFGFNLKKEQCTFQVSSRTIVVHLPGAVKSEVLLQKKKILQILSERLGEKSAPTEIL
jgi:hypothetical protein